MDGDGLRGYIRFDEWQLSFEDTRDLGKNWHLSFLRRHPDLKSKISSPRSMDRIIAQDRGIFVSWFDLFLEQKEQYRPQTVRRKLLSPQPASSAQPKGTNAPAKSNHIKEHSLKWLSTISRYKILFKQ